MSIVRKLRTSFHLRDERSRRVLATAAAGYVGRFGSGLVFLVTIPMARASLAPELFGVWMMLSSLVGFLAFTDLGVGNGVLNRVTIALATQDRTALRRTVASGYLCTGSLGLAMISVWMGWLIFSSDPLAVVGSVPGGFAGEIRAALTLFIVLMAVNIPAGLVQKVQLGAQQGHWLGLVQLGTALGTLVSLPLAIHLNAGLVALVASSLGVQVLVNVINSFVWLTRGSFLPGLLVPGWNDRRLVLGLLSSGSFFFLLQIAVAFAFQSDVIVITQVLGQRVYGDFAVEQRLFLLVSMVVASTTAGLWPAFGDAIARRDITWARRAFIRALTIGGLFAACASVILMLSMGWITRHWLHVAAPPALALTLLLGAWTIVDAMGAIAGAAMNGANALRLQAVIAIVMAVVAFCGKWWLTPMWGPAGAVAATLVAYLLICVPGQVFIFRSLLVAIRA